MKKINKLELWKYFNVYIKCSIIYNVVYLVINLFFPGVLYDRFYGVFNGLFLFLMFFPSGFILLMIWISLGNNINFINEYVLFYSTILLNYIFHRLSTKKYKEKISKKERIPDENKTPYDK
jgi:hypothetical protein